MCRLSVLRPSAWSTVCRLSAAFYVVSAHCITHGLGEVDFRLWSTWEPTMTGVSIAASGGWSSKASLSEDLGGLLLLRSSQERTEPPSSTSMQRPWLTVSGKLHVCEKPAPT